MDLVVLDAVGLYMIGSEFDSMNNLVRVYTDDHRRSSGTYQTGLLDVGRLHVLLSLPVNMLEYTFKTR